jgi:ATP-dependent protease ClpP protease subunit
VQGDLHAGTADRRDSLNWVREVTPRRAHDLEEGKAKMPMAYVSFCKPVNADTMSTLTNFVRSTLTHSKDSKPSNFDRVRIMISSGDGNVIAAFGAYNEIRSMPIEIHTMNTGATDSSALMIFMAGKKRYASAKSAFLFHQMA